MVKSRIVWWVQTILDSSVQADFPKKNRSEGQGCLKHLDTVMSHMLRQYRCCMQQIWNFSFRYSVALTVSFALWIISIGTQQKNWFLIGLLIRHAHTPEVLMEKIWNWLWKWFCLEINGIWQIFVSQRHLPEWVSDRQLALARHENIFLQRDDRCYRMQMHRCRSPNLRDCLLTSVLLESFSV